MGSQNGRVRRNHSAVLKAQILVECAVSGASVARVAMAYGINANIVHGWRKTEVARLVELSLTDVLHLPQADRRKHQ